MSITHISTSSADKISSNLLSVYRLQRDLTDIKTNPDNSPIIFASQVDDNPFHVEAAFIGPTSTPYENGIFLLDVKISDQFPFLPPQSITFKRPIMHPNVDECGKFMSNLLKPESWSPALTIKNVLEHVWARLAIPDTDPDECDLTRAHSYQTDRERFEIMAREYSIKYAVAT